MARPFAPLRTALCLGLVALPAASQTFQEALRLVPEGSLVCLAQRNAARNDRMASPILRAFTGKPAEHLFGPGDLMGVRPDLQTLPLLIVGCPDEAGDVQDVVVVGATDPAKVVARLKARRQGALWTCGEAKNRRWLAVSGRFVVVSSDRSLVERAIRKAGEPSSLEAHRALMEGHDLAVVALEPAMARFHAAFPMILQGMEAAAKAQPGADQAKMLDRFKGWMQALDQAVEGASLTVDLPEGGGVKAQAHVTFRPGKGPAVLPGAAGGALAGLPGGPWALAMGGPAAATGGFLETLLDASLAQIPEDLVDKARYRALLAESIALQEATSLVMGLPAQAGDPLCSHMAAATTVKDADRLLDIAEALLPMGQTVLEAQHAGLSIKGARETVEGHRAFVQTFDLSRVKLPPQMPPATLKMVLTLLFGTADHVPMTTVKVDATHVLIVLGGPREAARALASLGTPGPEAASHSLDALLPPAAPWRLLVDLKGVRDFADLVIRSFVPQGQGPAIPPMPATPPLGLSFSMDAQGADLHAAAAGETLRALGPFIREFKKAFPGPKAKGTAPAAPKAAPKAGPKTSPKGKPGPHGG